MCRTRQPKSPSVMMGKRRPRYSAEEKKLIAKAKAKRRRDEETTYFKTMESLIKGELSPFVDLPEKKILSVTLRLANVWKISYFILNQHLETPFTSQGKLLPKQSVLHNISDYILLILYRFGDSEQGSPFTILYVTSSVQHYLHISNSHELFGAKFEDYCCPEENGSFIDLRAPHSQKEKRTYPSVRCKIIQSHIETLNDRHEMRFYLLQAPPQSRGGRQSFVKVETATRRNKDDFSKFSPQYWRAMQARRRAIRRGAPKSLIIPEQLRQSRYPARQSENFSTCSTSVSPARHKNLVELSKILTEETMLPFTSSPYLSPPETRGSGMSTPQMVGAQGSGSGVATPVESVLELSSPCVSSSLSPVPQLNSSTESNLEAEIHPCETLQFLTDYVPSEFELPELARTIDPNDPIELPDSGSLGNASLSDITPTIGIDVGQIDVAEQMSKLSMSDIDSQGNFTADESNVSLSSMLSSQVATMPKLEPSDFIKQEIDDVTDGESKRRNDLSTENPRVLFTADCRREDISHLHNFLVSTTSSTYNRHDAQSHAEFEDSSKGQSDSSLLRRIKFSQNLLELESKESIEKMELGSSSDSLGFTQKPVLQKTSMKSSHSSGECFNAPRFIGDSRTSTQQSLETASPISKIILSQSDFEMQGTPPNSIGQDLSGLGGTAQKMSFTSVTDEQTCLQDESASDSLPNTQQ